MESTRREFVTQVAGTAAAWAQSGTGAVGADWYDRPMRWAQLAFVEDDPGNYDPNFWLDYFRRIHAEAACLSAGGCIAFYPTRVPLHFRSRWLGNTDPFGDMVHGCRKLGMNVVARTDPHAAHQDVYDAHPDWIAVDAEGNKRRHWADKDFWVTCALGPYNFEFMTAVTEEIVRMYGVDGVFSNRWSGSGMCYCEHCRENFRKFSGMELPRTLDPRNPARREYIEWRQARLFELWRLWDARIKAINPRAAFLANAGGGALSTLDMKTIGELAPTLFADRQGRSGLMPSWAAGKNGKEYRATLGQKAIAGITSVGLEDEFRWKDSVQNGDEIRLWMVDGIAQGLRPWFVKFNAKPIDKRWLPVIEQMYVWHAKHERYLRNERPLARVGMVYSQQTAEFYGGEQAREKVENEILGFYQGMVEARIPFEMVHDGLMDEEHLSGFRTLILPNIAALNEAQCAQVRAFAARGGSVVASYETSLYDAWGAARKDFGLAELWGASFDGRREGPMRNSYLTLERDQGGRYHPMLAGLEAATRIINGVNRVGVSETGDNRVWPLTVVPSYPDLPMEEVFPRPAKRRDPGVVVRENGASRVVYFPWDIGRTFWQVLNVDHGKLLGNAIQWATNEGPVVTVEGPGVIDLAVWEQKDSMTVHLVNLTNPMMMKGPVREVVPLVGQKVRVRVPAGRRATGARYLVADRTAVYRRSGDALEFETPQIGVHEVIAVDLDRA
jgi:hypothetical protein